MQKDPTRIQPEYVEILREMIEQNKVVTLTADIMVVNGIPFVVTYGRGIGSQGVFHVQTILMDMEFDKIKDLIPMINVNISATNEHVVEVEQRIRTIEERCWGINGILIEEDIGARVLEYILTQHSLSKGLRMYGKQDEFASKKELKQLHDMEMFQPIDPDILTVEKKQKAIASLMFLTENRDGTIKAHACADGHKQREHTDKLEAASPMAMMESIFITTASNYRFTRGIPPCR